MRIADKMGYDQVTSNLAKNRSDMSDLQNQAATQKRVTKPSDDPLAATRVLQTRTEISGGQQYLKSIAQAKAFIEYSEQSLGDMSEVLVRAKELAIASANDASTNSNSRAATAAEIDQLYQQAIQVGNRKLADRFLFGGFRTTQAPFDYEANYRGDTGEIQISIQKEGSLALNVPGSRVFLGRDDKAPATAGSGPSPLVPESSSESDVRGPASLPGTSASLKIPDGQRPSEINSQAPSAKPKVGLNIFQVLRDLSTGLKADDKEAIQESLDKIDGAVEQVILERAKLGARASTLNSATESLQKEQVDTKALKSSLEDADTFELVSDLNKTENTLKASLQTSGKLIQPSLLDFLR